MGTININRQIETAQERLNRVFNKTQIVKGRLEKADSNESMYHLLYSLNQELRVLENKYNFHQKTLKDLKAKKKSDDNTRGKKGLFKSTICKIVPANVRRKRNLAEQKEINNMVRISKIKIEEQYEIDRKKFQVDVYEIIDVMKYTLDQAIFLKKREMIQKEEHDIEIALNYYNKAETDTEIFKGIAKNRRNLLIMGAIFGAAGTVVSMGLESLIEEASLDAVDVNASRHLEVLAEIESRDPYWFNIYGHGMVRFDTFAEDMQNSTFDTAAGTPAYIIQSDAYQYTTTALSAASIVAPLTGAAVFDKLAKEGSPFDKTDKQIVKENQVG